METGDWQSAEADFSYAKTETQNQDVQFASRLNLARIAFQQGNSLSLLQEIESIIADYPQSGQLAEAYFLLAQVHEDAKRFIEAADAYASYLKLRPGIIDHYVFNLQGDAYFAAGAYLEAVESFKASMQTPGLIDQTFLSMKIARSYALYGDSEQAILLYNQIAQQTISDDTRALVLFRKGETFQQAGQSDLAFASFLEAVQNFPESSASYSALVALVNAGVPVDELQRGLVDFYADEYGVALAAFDRYLQNNPADPATAYYFSALAHRNGGRYEQAIIFLERIINQFPDHLYWVKAWEEKCLTEWYYLEDFSTAQTTLLNFAQSFPTHPQAADFIFDAARVAERAGDLKRAAELWRSLALQYPLDDRASESLFLSSISQFRLREYNAALQGFRQTLTISTTLEEKARANLWIGKSLFAQGETEAAKETWSGAASIDPTGYYSERALDLSLNKTPFSPPDVYDISVNSEVERIQAEAWLRTTFLIPDSTDLSGLGSLVSNPSVIRATELWNLGMQLDARTEFETLRQELEGNAELTFRLANYLVEIGLYRSATFAARHILDLAGLDDVSTLSAPKYFNRIRFGTYYSDLILPIAQEHQIHPLFLLSVIRQESLFESFANSSAAARGLMQIIPSTATELAEKLKWPSNYSESDLDRPIVNITFGAQYLSDMLGYFNGEMYPALAAYNGGPGNSSVWYELAQGDIDLFLEIIRFPETHEYIKRIYENFKIYSRIYGRSP